MQGGAANPTKIGTLSWTCTWYGPSSPPTPGQLVPCQGMISLTSGKAGVKKGYPQSTAVISFLAPAEGLVNNFIPNSNSLVVRGYFVAETGT